MLLKLRNKVIYRKESIKDLFQDSGFYIVNDLKPLYDMQQHLNYHGKLSREAKTRLKWMDYYKEKRNVSLTCRKFGISRKTFHKWHNRYHPYNLITLEDQSKTPINKRKREITLEQELRIIALRKKYICYSKIKLAKIYQRTYLDKISSWQIQKTIEKYKLYPNPARIAKITKRRLNAIKKKRITELKKRKPYSGFLICLDAIELRYLNIKRYIFTAIDYCAKVAFARMYLKANSFNAYDFLNRLMYLLDGNIENIQTDNGSEFEKYFNLGCQKLNLTRYYNRPHTPKDNPVNERFNRTIQDEFIRLNNFNPDPTIFNRNLTEWLIEYNFNRPHESLNYETPINFNNSTKVLPMYSSDTES